MRSRRRWRQGAKQKVESRKQKIEMAVGGEGNAPFSTPSAFGGENAKAPAIKIMSKIKIKTERNFANEVRIKERSFCKRLMGKG